MSVLDDAAATPQPPPPLPGYKRYANERTRAYKARQAKVKIRAGEPPTPRQRRLTQTHKLSINIVCKVIAEERGMLTYAAQRLGVSRSVLYHYIIDRTPCMAAYRDAREAMGDAAEKKLYELIEAGEVRCILFYLTNVHKARGYGATPKDADDPFGNGQQVFVNTVNVMAVPRGQFLDPAQVAQLAPSSSSSSQQTIDLTPEPSCLG